MIYIVKKSTKSSFYDRLMFDVTDAKKFIYNLEGGDFRGFEYFIYSDESEDELEELISYFNKDYIVSVESEMFTSFYTINKKIHKTKRLVTSGATIKSLMNFKQKIEKAIPRSTVDLTFDKETFTILLLHPSGDIKIICSYNLTILNSYALNRDGIFIDLSKRQEMIGEVNKIFRKQRYYYKKKESVKE